MDQKAKWWIVVVAGLTTLQDFWHGADEFVLPAHHAATVRLEHYLDYPIQK
jgi:hypothetical protein